MSSLRTELELIDADDNVYPLAFPQHGATAWSGTGIPPIRHWTTRAPFQTGETHWGYAVGPRVLNVTLYTRGCTRSQMYEYVRDTIAVLSPRSGPHRLRLITPPPDMRKYELRNVWVTNDYALSTQDQRMGVVQTGTVQLTAYDPIWKWVNSPLDAGETRDADGRTCVETSTITITDELTLPFTPPFLLGCSPGTATLTCTSDGTYATKPTITVEGPVYDWALENPETGHEITWDGYPIDAGETVTINVTEKTVTNQAGTNLSNYARGHVGSFELNPGANALSWWSSGGAVNGTTTIGVCWFLEVLGI